jgi:sulfonate transport system ATP-binding protein
MPVNYLHLEMQAADAARARPERAPRVELPTAARNTPDALTSAGRVSGATVRVQGVSKGYAGRPVLDGVDLHLAAGEFVAIVGRSGCGKSTLLRLLAGLDRADAGEITIDEAPAASAHRGQHRSTSHQRGRTHPASPQRGDVRIMFQDARLLPWKRVLDNVALGLTGPDVKARALEALAQVGLADRATEWPAVLSGGQRQRVALARALVHAPRLLLLDEPLGALDALTRIEMHRLIERLWVQHGFTALLVTHDVSEAIALADRVVLIEEHRVGLDERVTLARPRARGADFAQIEGRVLQRVLGQPDAQQIERLPLDTPIPAQALRWAI